MKVVLLIAACCLTACSWFGPGRHAMADPSEIIVNGAPPDASVLVDGVAVAGSINPADHPRVIRVASGDHRVEVQMADKVVYREQTYVGRGEHRVVTVLSGSTP